MLLKQIQRDSLLKPLQAVSGVVEKRLTMPILANVLLETHDNMLSVIATDLEIQITAREAMTCAAGQSVTVSARKLQDLLRALPDSSLINLEQTDNKLLLKANKSRFTLQNLPANDFPKLKTQGEQVQSVTISQKALKGLLHLVEYAMASQDIRFYLNGVLFVFEGNTLTAVATDGHRLSLAKIELPDLPQALQKQEIIVPRKTIVELSKLLSDNDEPVSIEIRTNQIGFNFGAIELMSKVIDGRFPDYERVIPQNHDKHLVFDRLTLLQSLQRAAILSNDKFRAVRLVLSAGSLKIVCSNSDQENAEEEIETDYQGETLDMGFNINYLLDVASTLQANEITLSFRDATDSVMITLPNRTDYKYVVMPMRI
jgi:DNA polymerase III subunit beta